MKPPKITINGSAEVDRSPAGTAATPQEGRLRASEGTDQERGTLTMLQSADEQAWTSSKRPAKWQHNSRDIGTCHENRESDATCLKSMRCQSRRRCEKRLSCQWYSLDVRVVTHELAARRTICLHAPQPRGELTASHRDAPEAGAHMVCCIEQRITGRGTPPPGSEHYARRCGWFGMNGTDSRRPRRCGSEIILSLGAWIEQYLRVGEAQHPGPDKMAPLQTEIVKEDGTSERIWLMCAHVKSRGMWRWQTTTAPRMVSGDKRTPWGALRSWIDKHKATLTLQGHEDLEAVLTTRQPEINTPEVLSLEPATVDTQRVAPTEDDAPAARLWGSVVPEQEYLRELLSSDLSDVLSMTTRAQVRIPKSMLSLIESTLHWLSDVAMNDGDITAQAASVMLILAPKLLWPEPEREGHKSLPPWSRPRIIQERIRLIHAGRWNELIQMAQTRRTGSMTKGPSASPEEVIKSEGRALLREVQRGRPGTAWKRVRGLGLLPTGDSTTDSVAAKWNPTAVAPPQRVPLNAHDREQVFTIEHLRSAVGRLKRGTAADAAGWTAEALQQLCGKASSDTWYTQFMRRWYIWEDDKLPGRLARISLITPLRKKMGSWEARPIAIPMLFHKVAMGVLQRELVQQKDQLCGDRQYGIGRPDGITDMVCDLHSWIRGKQDVTVLQLDMSNAFGTVSREVTWRRMRLLNTAPSRIAADVLSCIHTAILPTIHGGLSEIPTGGGIPQGDPCSPLLFATTLGCAVEQAIDDLAAAGLALERDYLVTCYLDDMTIACNDANARIIYRAFENALRQVDLDLNEKKTQIWRPHHEAPSDPEFRRLWEVLGEPEGVIICGQPVERPAEAGRHASKDTQQVADLEPKLHATPIGTQGFMSRWLQQRLEQYQADCRRLGRYLSALWS